MRTNPSRAENGPDRLQLIPEEPGFSGQDARHRARLAYAAYLGFLHLSRETPHLLLKGAELAAYVEHVIATLMPTRIATTPKRQHKLINRRSPVR